MAKKSSIVPVLLIVGVLLYLRGRSPQTTVAAQITAGYTPAQARAIVRGEYVNQAEGFFGEYYEDF